MAAPGSATTATSAAILKTQYNQPKLYWLSYKNNPSWAQIKKDEGFVGDSKVIAVQTEVPQGGGASIALAQANANPSVYQKFILTRIEDFGVARVTGQALKAAGSDKGALLNLWQREMDGILHTVKRSLAIHMQRNGTGSRGQISAGSTVGSPTITLAVTSDVTNFAVGMTLQATNGDGGALRSAGATIVLTGINRTTGSLTAGGNWTASIAAVAASDFLIRNGDQVNGVGTTVISGRGAWVPPADPGTTYAPTGYAVPATIFSLNRTSDVVRLGGLRLNMAGMPMQEALQEAAAMAQVEGVENDMVAYCHPRDRANFAKELGAKVVYTREEKKIEGSDARIGFSSIRLETDAGNVKVFADLNVQRGSVYIGDPESEMFQSIGPAPQILDFDSNDFLRYATDDSYEVRVGVYGNYSNAAPAFWVNGQGFGQ